MEPLKINRDTFIVLYDTLKQKTADRTLDMNSNLPDDIYFRKHLEAEIGFNLPAEIHVSSKVRGSQAEADNMEIYSIVEVDDLTVRIVLKKEEIRPAEWVRPEEEAH